MAVSEITSADELRDLYPIIEAGVAAIKAKQPVIMPHIAPDIYHRVLIGKVKLLVLHDDETVLGWCTFCVTERTGVCEDMYIAPGAPNHLLYEFTDTLEKSVQSEGATELVFTSTRRAWGRKMKRQGYSLRCFVFAKEF